MNENVAHFVVLPDRREDLWQRMSSFLGIWREAPAAGRGLDEGQLVGAEAALGIRFPPALREFYAVFGGLIDAGYFDDGYNGVLRPDQCRFVDEPGGAHGETLVIGDEYFGALWGIRREDLVHADPPIRCIDNCGAPNDGLFSLTEFLVGLLFRATVANAPFRIRLESSLEGHGEAENVHRELLARFSSWDRGNQEKDCGFISHIEGDHIIAALTAEYLDLGLKSESVISQLPEPLSGLIAAVARHAVVSAARHSP